MPQPVTARMPRAPSHAERCADLRDLHDRLRQSLDRARRAGNPVPHDLRARIAACEADLMEAQFDNMPI